MTETRSGAWSRRSSLTLLGGALAGFVPGCSRPSDLEALYAGRLDASQALDVLSRTPSQIPWRPVRGGGAPAPLEEAAQPLVSDARLEAYLERGRVAGLLILKAGQVRLERYRLGFGPGKLWPTFSVSKSVTTTIAAAAAEAGELSLSDVVAQHVPQLAAGPYGAVPLRELMRMRSGLAWTEGYEDRGSHRRALLRAQLGSRRGASVDLLNALTRKAAPGEAFNYSTADSTVLGWALEAAMKLPLTGQLERLLWASMMGHDARWWVERTGGAGLGGTGLCATLRDMARFAQVVLDDGVAGCRRLTPPGWFAAAGQAGRIADGYADGWWTPEAAAHGDAIYAEGIFGQFVYLRPAERLAVVAFSARPRAQGQPVDDLAQFAAIADALA